MVKNVDMSDEVITARLIEADKLRQQSISDRLAQRRRDKCGLLISPVHNWSTEEFGPLGVENVWRRYAKLDWRRETAGPPPFFTVDGNWRYEVRPQFYSDLTETSGTSFFDQICDMLNGRMSITLDDEEVELSAGEYCRLLAGAFRIENKSGGRLEFVRVYEIPVELLSGG